LHTLREASDENAQKSEFITVFSAVCRSLEQSIRFRRRFTLFFFLPLSVVIIGFGHIWNLGFLSSVQLLVPILEYRRDFVSIQRNPAIVV
jgi:hypothetical protein